MLLQLYVSLIQFKVAGEALRPGVGVGQRHLKVDGRTLLAGLGHKVEGLQASVIESTKDQPMASATSSIFRQNRAVAVKMVGVLVAAELQNSVPYHLAFDTIQALSLTPGIQFIIVIGQQKNIIASPPD